MQKYVKGSSIYSKLFCCEIAKGNASGILLPVTFPRAGKVVFPIRGEQFQANENAMIEDKWCNREHNNGPHSGCTSPRPRNNEGRPRELNHNEDDLNYEILPKRYFHQVKLPPMKITLNIAFLKLLTNSQTPSLPPPLPPFPT